MKRHLGDEYRVHTLTFGDPNPMHIDGTLNLIGPGLAIINPSRSFHQRAQFEKAGTVVCMQLDMTLDYRYSIVCCIYVQSYRQAVSIYL